MRNNYLDRLHTLPYFTAQTLHSLFSDVPKESLNIYLSYWTKNEKIYRLSKGFYVSREAYLQFKSNMAYRELVANKLSYPAYLSLEYVLSKYNILTEGVFGITAVTLKERKDVDNILGNFIYRQIALGLFTGYEIRHFLDYEYYEATKAKALFDFFYYRSSLFDKNNLNNNLFEELRLNIESFSIEEAGEFSSYAKLANNSKLIRISSLLEVYASNHK